jgi:cob(I)alamin adenosyltransferase
MPRLTKIVTKKGDSGFTTLGDNLISKDDILVEVVGTIDELNSAIGLVVVSNFNDSEIKKALLHIQNDLFDFGGELHLPQHQAITPEKTQWLEEKITTWNDTLPTLKEFVIPGGNPAAAACHLARAICRRAERCVVKLHRQESLNNTEMLRYLNRLSDALFVISRLLARATDKNEKMWEHE